jgi:ADP-heptose:LPS heptosyltransferase
MRLAAVVNEGTEAPLADSPSVDQVIVFPRREAKKGLAGVFKFLSFSLGLRGLRPDVAIDLAGTDRSAIMCLLSGAGMRIGYYNRASWSSRLLTHHVHVRIYEKHMVEYHLDLLRELGMTIHDNRIRICLNPGAIDSVKIKAPSIFAPDGRKIVLVHPGARIPLRQWGADRFALLCNRLAEDCRILLVAGPSERNLLDEIVDKLNFTPEFCSTGLDVQELAVLCGQADMFIGNDSGPLHVASGLTYTVALYGPSGPDVVGPWTERKCVIEPEPIYCRPCRQDRCVNERYKACFETVTPEAVYERLRDILPKL